MRIKGDRTDGHAVRSLSCVMGAHDQCQNPTDKYVKPGCIPGSGGKLCACVCHDETADKTGEN